MWIYIHIHIYVYVYLSMYLCIYIYVYMYIQIYTYTYIYNRYIYVLFVVWWLCVWIHINDSLFQKDTWPFAAPCCNYMIGRVLQKSSHERDTMHSGTLELMTKTSCVCRLYCLAYGTLILGDEFHIIWQCPATKVVFHMFTAKFQKLTRLLDLPHYLLGRRDHTTNTREPPFGSPPKGGSRGFAQRIV